MVKAYALENQYQKNMVDLANESKTKSMSLAKVQSLFGPLMIALIGVSNLVVIYFGGMMYIDGTIKSIGTIAEFILYVNMLTWPVASIGWVSSLVQEAEASQKRINEFLKVQPSPPPSIIVSRPTAVGPTAAATPVEPLTQPAPTDTAALKPVTPVPATGLPQ